MKHEWNATSQAYSNRPRLGSFEAKTLRCVCVSVCARMHALAMRYFCSNNHYHMIVGRAALRSLITVLPTLGRLRSFLLSSVFCLPLLSTL